MHLGDPVGNVIDDIQSGYILLVQEINSLRFLFAENSDQDIGAGRR